MQINFNANVPQGRFLALNTKYRGYVAGFGCVHPNTKIWTEHGLMRISDISCPTRVLSWNEKSQRFQLSLSGGSYRKQSGNLYQVLTMQGEFAAAENHRTFSSEHKYLRVDHLSDGGFYPKRLSRHVPKISGDYLKLLPSDAAHYSEKVASSMGRYADEARQYGQQLRMEEYTFQSFAQGRAYVLELYRSSFGMGGILGPELTHTLRHLISSHLHNLENFRLSSNSPVEVVEDLVLKLCLQHKRWEFDSQALLSLISEFHKMISPHRTMRGEHQCDAELDYDSCSFSYLNPSLMVDDTIVTVFKIKGNFEHYDMQVLDTNNYVDEYGFIHHNSGKTVIGSVYQGLHYYEHPKVNQGYFAPTYSHIRDIYFPTIEEVAHWLGLRVEIREGNKEVHFYSGRKYRGTTICRSLEKPETIVGFKIGHALIDEFDLSEQRKAKTAWRKIIARLRWQDDTIKNGADITTTPEGFKETYRLFVEEPNNKPELRNSYGLIQASTYDNEKNLPDDYIQSLLDTYPEELISAYLNGQFVNLTSGTVYRSYNRLAHASHETVQANDILRIGMDFNVTKMAAVVFVARDNGWHAVDELKDIYDTPDMIRALKARYPAHRKIVYPDASGGSRKTVDASSSDLSLLKQAGFEVKVNATNPAVKDRIMSVNKQFEINRLFVNAKMCPTTAKNLEQQAYDINGEPDKKSGFDHQNDAFGYPIAHEFPITRNSLNRVVISGI